MVSDPTVIEAINEMREVIDQQNETIRALVQQLSAHEYILYQALTTTLQLSPNPLEAVEALQHGFNLKTLEGGLHPDDDDPGINAAKRVFAETRAVLSTVNS